MSFGVNRNPTLLAGVYRFGQHFRAVAIVGWTMHGEPMIVDREGDVEVVPSHRVRVVTEYAPSDVEDALDQAAVAAMSARCASRAA